MRSAYLFSKHRNVFTQNCASTMPPSTLQSKANIYCSTSTLQASLVILHLHRPSPNYLLHDTVGIANFLHLKHHVQFHGVPWLRSVHCPSMKWMNFRNCELFKHVYCSSHF